jgi:hypothetical protein
VTAKQFRSAQTSQWNYLEQHENARSKANCTQFVSTRFFHPVTSHVQQIPEDIERGEEVWEVRGYETGEFLGTPAEVLRDVPKETRRRRIQQERDPDAFGFYTRFEYSSFKLVK